MGRGAGFDQGEKVPTLEASIPMLLHIVRTMAKASPLTMAPAKAHFAMDCRPIIMATPADWSAFGSLVHTDRSYLAFCVDPVLFAMVQPCILGRVKNWKLEPIDYVPFVGLMVWLWKADE